MLWVANTIKSAYVVTKQFRNILNRAGLQVSVLFLFRPPPHVNPSSGWLSKMAARSYQSCTPHPMHPHRERAPLPTITERKKKSRASLRLASFEPIIVTNEMHALTGLGLKIITLI